MHPFPVPDSVEAWPYARSRFYCPARHHFQATPTSPPLLTPALPVSSSLACAYRRRITAQAGGISGPISRPLSLHAADLTPGPPPVHLPFSSRRTLAFPQNVRGRRVALFSQSLSLYRTLPIIFARSELTRLHHSFSYYGLQVWPAPLIGFAVPCRGKFRPGVTTRTRPQPTYLQLAPGMAGSFHPASEQFRYLIHGGVHAEPRFAAIACDALFAEFYMSPTAHPSSFPSLSKVMAR